MHKLKFSIFLKKDIFSKKPFVSTFLKQKRVIVMTRGDAVGIVEKLDSSKREAFEFDSLGGHFVLFTSLQRKECYCLIVRFKKTENKIKQNFKIKFFSIFKFYELIHYKHT